MPPEPVTTQGFGAAQVILSPPPTFRIGGGPYTVPISITNVSRLSTITLTVTYDPSIIRVRSVQEGSFMRSGGANATFTQQIAPGRVDITIVRAADATGATGTGLIAALLIDAVAARPGHADDQRNRHRPGRHTDGRAVPPRGRDGAAVARSEI